MKLISGAIRNSTAVIVGMILIILAGILAIRAIPVQLNPTIEAPYITVETTYPGASATEVEQEITQKQEEQLAAVENVRELRSTSSEGNATISLKFDWGVNKDLAGLDVLKKLNLVEDLPEDAEEPQILFVNREEEDTILWLYTALRPGTNLSINQQRKILDETILPQLARTEGVSNVHAYGGTDREIHVLVDPQLLTARNVSLNQVAEALARENRMLRGGDIDRGEMRFIVRTPAQFSNLEQILSTVVTNGPGGPIRIRDLGTVHDTFAETEINVRVSGADAIAIGIVRRTGANALEVAELVKQEIERINAGLNPRGMELRIAYDASKYIWESIYNVRDDLLLGAALAVAVLWLFLRSISGTLIIGANIPVCMIGTFILMAAFGRSVNVISLAGLGFASGLIVDDGIVVIENIYHHRVDRGKPLLRAAYDATVELWGPIFTSSMATLAVFVPILFIQEEAGQLFRDIAYSISFAVFLSMYSAVTIVPMFASRVMAGLKSKVAPHDDTALGSIGLEDCDVLRGAEREACLIRAQAAEDEGLATRGATAPAGVHRRGWLTRTIDAPLFWIGRQFNRVFIGTVEAGTRSPLVQWSVILSILLFCGVTLFLVPPAEYLPQGNRNLILGIFKVPAGLSLEGTEKMMSKIEARVLALPELERTFFVMLPTGPIFGLILKDEFADKANIQRVIGELSGFAMATFTFPDVIPIVVQLPVFGGGLGGGKSLTLDIRGPDLRKLDELSNTITGKLMAIPGVQQVRPSLDLGNPELQVIPNRERLADLGLTASDVAETIETIVEGRTTSQFRDGGREYDLKLLANEELILSATDLENLTLTTPAGQKVKLADVAKVEQRLGPVKIDRLEQDRAATLEVQIDEKMPLETVIAAVRSNVLDPLLPTLPFEYTVQFTGSADDLSRTMAALSESFILALIISYLLMAALFRSFLYPLIIMFSVPLAMSGAFLGIWAMNAEFNVITMIGFILLAGVVVKNAILLVEVTLEEVRNGTPHDVAVVSAVHRRIRPIMMTAVSSVLGMLPLALGRGSGAELYSGLGVAVVGGQTLSTIFTLILIPLLMKLALDVRDSLAIKLGRSDLSEAGSAKKLAELDAEI